MSTVRARNARPGNVKLAGVREQKPTGSRGAFSTFSRVAVATLVAVTVFFVAVWWLRENDGAPFVAPLALAVCAAGFFVGIAVLIRVFIVRSAVDGGLREQEKQRVARQKAKEHLHWPASASVATAALRAFEKRIAKAESFDASPEMHLELHNRCQSYLTSMEEALGSGRLPVEVRAALRAGQQRIRTLQKHHILSWARIEAQRLTQKAQQQRRASDKVRTANRALDAIIRALNFEPQSAELRASATALREFIAYVKIGRRVKLAEHAAFRGRYERALDYYYDALFDLSKAEIDETARIEAERRIGSEIELMRSRMATAKSTQTSAPLVVQTPPSKNE